MKSSKKLSLYGNLIFDSVHCVKDLKYNASNEGVNNYTSVGAIGNVLRAIDKIDKNLSVDIYSQIGLDHYGSYIKNWLEEFKFEASIDVNDNVITNPHAKTTNAVIISDLFKIQRSSIVNWGACAEMANFDYSPSDWTHIMYADTLENLDESFIKKVSKDSVLSMDLCLSNYSDERKMWIISMLKYVDYLIVSDVEAAGLMSATLSAEKWRSFCVEETANFLGSRVKNRAIIHTPHGSTVSNGKNIHSFTSRYITNKNLNVLGAGDIFASSFITSMLKNNTLEESMAFAHENTTLSLQQRKK